MMKNYNDTLENSDAIVMREYDNTSKRIQELPQITTKARTGKCIVCGRDTKYCTRPVSNQRRGVKFCELHADASKQCAYYSYHSDEAQNYGIKGTPTIDGVTFGLEVEMNGHSQKFYDEMCAVYKYLPTLDCTVSAEYVSPIYNSLSPLAKVVGFIEACNNDENIDVDVTSDNVGLHTHFGSSTYNENMAYKYYSELFGKLNKYIKDLSDEQRVDIFGSSYRYYAKPCDMENPYWHKNIFNIEHEHTIEVRLFRFSTAYNYMKGVKIMRETLKPLLTSNMDTLTRTKAIAIGDKMVETFDKHIKSLHDIR